MNTPPRPRPSSGGRAAVTVALWILRFGLSAAIIYGGFRLAVWFKETRPVPEKREPRERAAVVVTETARKGSFQVMIEAAGTVIPARALTLQPRVAGEIIAMNPEFLPGGRLTAGDPVVKLDPADFALNLDVRGADLVRAEYEQTVEMGRQDIARREWDMIDVKEDATELERELMLRKPHLANAKAAVAAARASVEKARLELERTEVKAPFNAVVLDRYVEIGAQVTAQTRLADLVGTDEFWVLVSLPADELSRVTFPDGTRSGSPVELRTGGGLRTEAVWQGTVLRRRPDLEDRGRLARILVSVTNPLNTTSGKQPLLLGSYVSARIRGPELKDVFVLPRSAVHDGGTVWIRNAEGRLEFRRVTPLLGDRENLVIADGLAVGDDVVLSDVGAPVPGLLLRIEGEAGGADSPKGTGGPGPGPAGAPGEGGRKGP